MRACACYECPRLSFLPLFPPAGQFVWRRHGPPGIPSHHAVRATCTQLLPLVEMYCRWELEEDCGNLNALMHRFDSESVLDTHALGRSLLLMLRDEDVGLRDLPAPLHFTAEVNPFEEIRSRLHAVDTAFQGLRPQVCLVVDCLVQFFGCWVDIVPLYSTSSAASYVFVATKMNGEFHVPVFSPLHIATASVEHVYCTVWDKGLPLISVQSICR